MNMPLDPRKIEEAAIGRSIALQCPLLVSDPDMYGCYFLKGSSLTPVGDMSILIGPYRSNAEAWAALHRLTKTISVEVKP